MPVDMEKFRLTIQEILKCSACKSRLEGTVYKCIGQQGHIFCLACRNSNNYCSIVTCNSQFDGNAVRVLNEIVTAFYFNCKYATHGCEEVATPQDLIKHEKICNYRTVKCILLKNGQNCTDEIPLPKLIDHIETYHDSYVKLLASSDVTNLLPKKTSLESDNCHYRVFKNADEGTYFLEMIYYDDDFKMYQISVHYIGKQSDANNYIYEIEIINNSDSFQCYKYSNLCLANLLKPDEAKKFYPFILIDQDDKFSVHEDVHYKLKIKKFQENVDSDSDT